MRVVLALAALICCLGLVQKAPCLQTHWSDDDARYAGMCYSDIPYLYTDRGFAEQTWPYSDTPGRYRVMEYPVGISYLAWGTSWLTRPIGTGPSASVRAVTSTDSLRDLPGMPTEINRYFLLNAAILLGLALLATYWLTGAHRERPWDALAFAGSPLLLLNGLINWDLLAVACVAGALWSWARGRPVLTGVLLGLGTAAKFYPLFLFGAVLVVCLRRRQHAVFVRSALAGAVAWLLVNLPAMLTGWDQWKGFWRFNRERGADAGSLWLLVSDPTHPVSAHTVNVWSWGIFALCCAGILVVGLVAEQPPRMAQVGLLILTAFLVINKVYSPQYVLWLLPLAVLARPRWRDLIIWQACELYYFGSVWLYLGGYTASGAVGAGDLNYNISIVVRVLGELYLAGLVLRDVLEPEKDPVRAGAPDRAVPGRRDPLREDWATSGQRRAF